MNYKVWLITGATGELGSQTAELITKNSPNDKLILTGRNEKKMEEIMQKLDDLIQTKKDEKKEIHHLSFITDLTKEGNCSKLIEFTISSFKKLDVLISCGGISEKEENFVQFLKLSEWDEVFQVNFRSVVDLVQQSIPYLKETQGNIVVVSSISGKIPESGAGAYCCSKAALNMLVKVLALELGTNMIRVNAVSPSTFDSSMHSPFFDTQSQYNKFLQNVQQNTQVINSNISALDIANSIYFLASPQAKSITGMNLVVDCGVSLKNSIEFLNLEDENSN
ncbi:hypothetical protein M0811_09618 [Anaeramoeba ignava]|uniref:Uncharacterized protein n=1 Tax=Anaeramoeba ignava TaxID=1746090 RepID=A0A9Q0RA85_ANAIG|nr:hypothetical protein M0811_09618 [Anaeramoeba ignava]